MPFQRRKKTFSVEEVLAAVFDYPSASEDANLDDDDIDINGGRISRENGTAVEVDFQLGGEHSIELSSESEEELDHGGDEIYVKQKRDENRLDLGRKLEACEDVDSSKIVVDVEQEGDSTRIDVDAEQEVYSSKIDIGEEQDRDSSEVGVDAENCGDSRRIDVGAHLKRYTERRHTCKMNKNAITEVKKYPKRERKNTDSLKTIYEDDNLDENDGDSDKENDGYDHETTVKRKKRVKRNRKINEDEDLDEDLGESDQKNVMEPPLELRQRGRKK